MSAAWTLYLIGFAATATSPVVDPVLKEKSVWIALGVGLAWPPLATAIVAARLWRLWRND